MGKIKERYIFTNNKDDKILCQEYYCIIDDDKGKIDTELKSINIFKSKCKSRGDLRDKWCFYGIVSKKDEEENENPLDK